MEIRHCIFVNRSANADAQLTFAIETQIAVTAAIRPARHRFEFINDFHGAELWRAGNAAAGKRRCQRREMRDVFAQTTFNSGHEMLHLSETFELREFRHLHATEFAETSEVVTQ